MTPEAFSSLVGGALFHITATGNAEGIARHGLRPAAVSARAVGVNPAAIALRADRRVITGSSGQTVLNHQRPLRMGARAHFLDGHTLVSWARQLDERVFFWPAGRGKNFAASMPKDVVTYRLDAGRFYAVLCDQIDLSPINSGNAARRPARRGDWLYVPARAGVEAFRENRRQRGLKKGRDAVAEVSVRAAIPAAQLEPLLA
ncbi:MAG: hypothetical protein AAF943_07095 [Pseudomonadota bacterium]